MTGPGRVRGRPYDLPLPSEPSERLSPHSAQALIRHREAPGDQVTVIAFTIRVCNRLTWRRTAGQSMLDQRAAAPGGPSMASIATLIVSSNHTGLTFPSLSRDPRPGGSQPPFRAGQFANPYPVHYRPAFASSAIPYPLVHRYTLAGGLPPPCGNDGAYHVSHEYHS
jgi:hypothetical protein